MNLLTYMNFGRLPARSRREKLKEFLRGTPNLLKRLQAPSIMRALNLQAGDRVLDFGCGSGYVTFEMARSGANAVGIDVTDYIEKLVVPDELKNNLRFLRTSGEKLPFENEAFDVVLASEVLPMIPNPVLFLQEMKRVLKKNGILVVVNGLGFHTIKKAYEQNSEKLKELRLKYGDRVPQTYQEYIQKWQPIAGTAQKEFLTENDIIKMVQMNGFRIESKEYTPSKKAGEWLAWDQFELFLSTGRVIRDNNFVPDFIKLSLMSLFDKDRFEGGLILRCRVD